MLIVAPGSSHATRIVGQFPAQALVADLDASGVVDGADLGLLLGGWTPT